MGPFAKLSLRGSAPRRERGGGEKESSRRGSRSLIGGEEPTGSEVREEEHSMMEAEEWERGCDDGNKDRRVRRNILL